MIEIGIFISHSWAHSGHYDKLSEWIFDEHWSVEDRAEVINFVNLSIDKDNPIHNAPNAAALELEIRAQIAGSHVVVIPTGMYDNYSKWIQREIAGARFFGRPILAVDPWNQERSSSIAVDASTDHCGWNKKSVVQKIYTLYCEHS